MFVLTFLGHVIDRNGVSTDRSKIEKILSWLKPSNSSELHSFVGFFGYYRNHIRNFSEIIKPLQDLIDKDGHKSSKRKIDWNSSACAAFERVKGLLCDAPVLALPVKGAKYVLDADASGTGIGGVLSRIVNGKEKVYILRQIH